MLIVLNILNVVNACAVSTSMEERLYWLLNLKGITYITISHRPVLEAFHRKILCINGDEVRSLPDIGVVAPFSALT